MIFKKEQLLTTLGLKIGDKIKFECEENVYEIVRTHSPIGDIELINENGGFENICRLIGNRFYFVKENITEKERLILSMLDAKYERITRLDGKINLIYYKSNFNYYYCEHKKCSRELHQPILEAHYEVFDHFENCFKWVNEDVEYNIKELLK